jgi:hypothetical protein
VGQRLLLNIGGKPNEPRGRGARATQLRVYHLSMPRKPPSSASPTVTITRRGAERLKSGHVWVYRSDIVSSDGVPPGALIQVADERGKSLGAALYSSASQIAIRLISSKPVDDLETLLRERIRAAIAYRERVVWDSDAYRIIFSEGDFLPGLIVDRYNDLLTVQSPSRSILGCASWSSLRCDPRRCCRKRKPAPSSR